MLLGRNLTQGKHQARSRSTCSIAARRVVLERHGCLVAVLFCPYSHGHMLNLLKPDLHHTMTDCKHISWVYSLILDLSQPVKGLKTLSTSRRPRRSMYLYRFELCCAVCDRFASHNAVDIAFSAVYWSVYPESRVLRIEGTYPISS